MKMQNVYLGCYCQPAEAGLQSVECISLKICSYCCAIVQRICAIRAMPDSVGVGYESIHDRKHRRHPPCIRILLATLGRWTTLDVRTIWSRQQLNYTLHELSNITHTHKTLIITILKQHFCHIICYVGLLGGPLATHKVITIAVGRRRTEKEQKGQSPLL